MNASDVPRRLLRRQVSVSKPHVGRLVLMTGWVRRNRVVEAWFQPVGRTRVVPVGPEAVEGVLAAGSFEQAMAAVRSHG